MSVLRDTLDAVRGVILLRKEVTDLAADLRDLARAHTDTRERLIRIEALVEAATARRVPRSRSRRPPGPRMPRPRPF